MLGPLVTTLLAATASHRRGTPDLPTVCSVADGRVAKRPIAMETAYDGAILCKYA